MYAILSNNKLILVIINNYMVRDMSISTNRSLTNFNIHAYKYPKDWGHVDKKENYCIVFCSFFLSTPAFTKKNPVLKNLSSMNHCIFFFHWKYEWIIQIFWDNNRNIINEFSRQCCLEIFLCLKIPIIFDWIV